MLALAASWNLATSPLQASKEALKVSVLVVVRKQKHIVSREGVSIVHLKSVFAMETPDAKSALQVRRMLSPLHSVIRQIVWKGNFVIRQWKSVTIVPKIRWGAAHYVKYRVA